MRGLLLAGLKDLQNFPGGFDIQPGEVAFHPLQFSRGNSEVGRTQEQQRHRRGPREIQGFGQNQNDLLVLIDHSAFYDVDRQIAQQRESDCGLVEFKGIGELKQLLFV